jgi:thioredoxin-like negative regulator of GroEL
LEFQIGPHDSPRENARVGRRNREVWGNPPKLLESVQEIGNADAHHATEWRKAGLPAFALNISPRTQSLPTRKQLEQLLESDPDDVFLQYALAKACVTEGDLEAGLSKFQEVIDGHPQYVPAYFQKGQALAEQGRAVEARNILMQGIQAARTTGDRHAEAEMTEFLEVLGSDS